jgi:uncharacterized membrane protein
MIAAEYIILLISSMVLDGIWLGLISKSLYKKYICDLMLKTPHIFPAILFYVIFAFAAMMFVITPAMTGQWSLGRVMLYGAVLGLVIYGGYDLTNLAILKDWPIAISIIDIAWGITFSTLGSLITVVISRLIIK